VFLLPGFLDRLKSGKLHAAMASAASCLIAAFYFYTQNSASSSTTAAHRELVCFGAIALLISKYAGERSSVALAH